ncbi:hypothetical protein LZQ00_13940 [Sphingobacterium sp. SRCM116780]|uniref:hypothetical protein n=1 Tax=Sphingobacterium sp. SRCM116780 TaxID=2907623 RepID=UPI001F2C6973|nr:hypothetical protein [Sphingobacterium sp. SRCM116780]UIR55362.1 hypothetical protein LZQ00_13940 [Sphingobacterium sp. SRCM116780]
MDSGKFALVQLVTVIHFALMAIALFRLFRLKNVTGGFVILSILGLCIPILGPFGLIFILNKKKKEEDLEEQKKRPQQIQKHKKSPKK